VRVGENKDAPGVFGFLVHGISFVDYQVWLD
jgi:hypothetical protein